MNIDFQKLLVILTLIAGLITLIDQIWFVKRRKATSAPLPIVIDYARSFFPVLLLVVVIRSFIVQPFRVPTGSLEPTVMPNDFVAVKQFSYGLRLPITNTKILSIGEPKLGDIVVFKYPLSPTVDYIKRVIGTPGDHIIYRNKTLTINGKVMEQKFIKKGIDFEPPNTEIPVDVKEENLNGVKHLILINPKYNQQDHYDFVVPPGQYFMMGDNRDNSADSRYWGFVSESHLIGKAFFIWFSWDSLHYRVRWERIGLRL